MHRLAIVASHPIQYQAPWFRALALRTDLTVFFCHRQDRDGQAAAGYGVPFDWDVPLLDGYQSVWLDNVARTPHVSRFTGCDTPEIFGRIRDGRFDACIVSGWYLKSYLQAIRAGRQCGVPVLLRGDSQLETTRSPLTRALKYLPYRLLLNSVAGHLYVGEANRRYLAHYGVPPERLFFVPHSVDEEWFATRAAEARAAGADLAVRRELGIADAACMVLFVGRVVPQKRPLDFVDAIGRAAKTRDIVGVIAGSGPLAAVAEERGRQARSPLRLIGFRNQSALPALYAAAQMLVLPSDGRETWGLVVNEAMACGTPAIVSNAVGCANDLIGPQTGRIYPLGDVDALAEAIVAMDGLRRSHADDVRVALSAVTARFSAVAAAEATVAAIARVSGRLSAAA
jgi:glycosyltransferase involved in cell wall biosynthesis